MNGSGILLSHRISVTLRLARKGLRALLQEDASVVRACRLQRGSKRREGDYRMRVRTLVLVGVTSLALAVSPAFVTGAAASVSKRPTVSLAAGHHGKVVAPHKVTLTGKCKTAFGTPLSTPDGLIAWNDGSGSAFDTAGAADVRCKHGSTRKARTIKKVIVNGYFGDAGSSQFNVTFYKNLNAEPNDNAVLCATQTVTGSPTGAQYPTNDTTTITLTNKCVLKAGVNWISLQILSPNGPWYWEMQNERQGFPPDWRDVYDAFGSGCTTWNNGRYLEQCLGYTYGDWMLVLR